MPTQQRAYRARQMMEEEEEEEKEKEEVMVVGVVERRRQLLHPESGTECAPGHQLEEQCIWQLRGHPGRCLPETRMVLQSPAS